MSHFFQDMTVGHEIDLGTFTFTAEHIKRYASLYDTQPEIRISERFARQAGKQPVSGCAYLFSTARKRL